MLVAGVDSSTQSCKVVVRDAETGRAVRSGRAPHPDELEVDPQAWWTALEQAAADAGGLDDVAALGVAAQQHGMVALDDAGDVVRPALLWNDTRSAGAARDLVVELGGGDAARGRQRWAEQTGIVPVASFTVTKVRWMAEHEPENAARSTTFALPHDWLTRGLLSAGPSGDLDLLVTDAGDASGTGWFDAGTRQYRPELLERALGPRRRRAAPAGSLRAGRGGASARSGGSGQRRYR